MLNVAWIWAYGIKHTVKGIELEDSVMSVPPPFPETFSPNLKVPIEKKKNLQTCGNRTWLRSR